MTFVFSAGAPIVMLFVAALWTRRGERTRGKWLTAIAIGYALISIYVVAHTMRRLLAAGFHPFATADAPDGRTAVVLLGSASITATGWNGDKYSVVNGPATERVLEAVRVYRLIHPQWVISSGGLSDPRDPNEATGLTMRDALVQLGVPPERIRVETVSRNTHDEAVVIAPILASLRTERVVLVTSDVHMRRSVGTFRAAGIEVVPAIANDSLVPVSWAERVLPSERGLHEADTVAHEVIGIGFYLVRGWYRF